MIIKELRRLGYLVGMDGEWFRDQDWKKSNWSEEKLKPVFSMKHLIIGYGNMGKRYAKILRGLGDQIHHIDIHDRIATQHLWGYDSVLICTPAETHKDIIDKLRISGDTKSKGLIPIFCEKPLYLKKAEIVYPALTMVSCNWRFCACARKPTIFMYPNAIPLDLIHFLDLLWHRNGKPQGLKYASIGNSYWLSSVKPWADFAILKSTSVTEAHSCAMFLKQMKSWRNQLRGKEEPCNPFPQAKKRTDCLIDLISGRKKDSTTT